jgi:hypothetical protein
MMAKTSLTNMQALIFLSNIQTTRISVLKEYSVYLSEPKRQLEYLDPLAMQWLYIY